MPGYFNDIEGTRVLSKTTARIIDNVEIRTFKNHMKKMIYLILFVFIFRQFCRRIRQKM